jgi:hypothetical protein
MIEFILDLHNFLLLTFGLNVKPKTASVVFPSRVSGILSKAADLKRVRREKLLRRTRFNTDYYSNRVPTALEQPIPGRLTPCASKDVVEESVVNLSPLSLNRKVPLARAVKESIYGIAATGKPALSVPFRNQEQGFFECLL